MNIDNQSVGMVGGTTTTPVISGGYIAPQSHRCPNCGACPCCGRNPWGYQPPPFAPWPNYPQPYFGDYPGSVGIGTATCAAV